MRILLADDHDLVRDALAALLVSHDASASVVSVSDLPAALDEVRGNAPFDVVILDLHMPGMEGLSGVRRMLETHRGAVALMSGAARPDDVRAALDLGVKGFIPKTLSGKALINAVRLVAAGETYAPASVFRETDPAGGALTARELQVLGQLRHGTANKEIARVLGITETTVKLHLRGIGEKLDAKNRVEMVVKAIDLGLI